MDGLAEPVASNASLNKSKLYSAEFSTVLEEYKDTIKVLSLDCFDTLLWRKTAAPKDVFAVMQNRPLCKSLGVTAHQRIRAAHHASRKNWIEQGKREISLQDIYQQFRLLSAEQRHLLIQEELATEKELCYAFQPTVELIRLAKTLRLKVIIVSDTYLIETQLRQLLEHCLPKDCWLALDHVFCSSEYGQSKKEGLFEQVKAKLAIPASSILHIGDNETADYQAALQHGIKTLHFIQFDTEVAELLRLQNTAATLVGLGEPTEQMIHPPRYNLFKALLSSKQVLAGKPESIIGYATLGPILYAFAQFILNEMAELQKSGKQLKVFFLLRDGYLLAKACESLAGYSVGKMVRLRKSIVRAASFRTREDVDYYLIQIDPGYFNLRVICQELLLPQTIIDPLERIVMAAQYPEKALYEYIHQEEVLQFILQKSALYQSRLLKYIHNEMNIMPGDTIMLVDTGYLGTTQDFFMRLINEERIEIVGRYLVASHEPNRPQCKGLFTSLWCDHGLLEQACTHKEGAVIDYDQDSNPIFDSLFLRDEQYNKVADIQAECLRFIHDAKKNKTIMNVHFTEEMLKNNAAAALNRHVYFPLYSEVNYFKTFQHDKDMGHDLNKTFYDLSKGREDLRRSNSLSQMHPYEARMAGLEVILSKMLARNFALNLAHQDVNIGDEMLTVIIVQGSKANQLNIRAVPTHEGYYVIGVPVIQNSYIGIVFGEKYRWFELDSVRVMTFSHAEMLSNSQLVYNKMDHHDKLIHCQSTSSLLMLRPLAENPLTRLYQVVFRPLIRC